MKQTPTQSAIDDFDKRNSLIERIEGLRAVCTKEHPLTRKCGAHKYNRALDDVLKIVREYE